MARYEEERYGGSNDYVLTRPRLTPRQVIQVETGLSEARGDAVAYEQLTADQNNFALFAGVVHLLTSDASRTITGFANVGPGIEVIANRGAQDIVLANDNGGSAEANRILTHTTANITLGPSESVAIFYDRESSRVRTLGF